MKMVLLIGGKKQHGKDTLAREVKSYLDLNFKLTSVQLSYAETMKDILIDLGIITEDEAYNSNKKGLTSIRRDRIREDIRPSIAGEYLTIRDVLQIFGNDIMKGYFGEEVWVKAMAHRILSYSEENIFIIPDYRFHGLESDKLFDILNEFDEDVEIHTCYVVREGASADADDHDSENSLSPGQCDLICSSKDKAEIMEHAVEWGERIYDVLSRMQ